MLVNKKSILYFNYLSDVVFLFSTILIAYIIHLGSFSLILQHYHIIIIVFSFWYIFGKYSGLYDDYRSRDFTFQLIALLKTILYLSGLLIFYYFLFKGKYIDRKIIFYFISITFFTLVLKYYVLKKIFDFFRSKGKNIRSILLLGGGPIGEELYKSIISNPNLGYSLYGVLDDKKKTFLNGKYLGSLDNFENVLKHSKIDDVVIALPSYAVAKIKTIVKIANIYGKKTRIIPDYKQFLSNKFEISIFANLPVLTLRSEPLEEVQYRFIKRTFDIVFSLFVIIFILSWLTPLLAIVNLFYSRGSTFFIQDRIGKNEKIFKAYKYRSMHVNSSKNRAAFLAVTENDNRISQIGKFLRKTNLDELPQFINVLKGDMSIVGPRPHAIAWNDKYTEYFHEIKLRHRVKPGITGWAQIHALRGDVEDEEENKKRTIKRIEFDLWYIENWSFKLDMQIIILTVWNMLKGNNNAI